MSKHNYTNPAFCQNSEFYPIPSANKDNIESIYNRSLQVNFNTSSSSHYDKREGPLRMQRSMSTRSVAVKRSINECTPAAKYQQQIQQQQQPRRSTASQNSNQSNHSFEQRCGSGRFALVPVEDLTPTLNNRYAIVPGSTVSSSVLQNSRRYARSQDDLDCYSSQTQLEGEEEPHSFHEDPAGNTYTSLPPILDQQLPQLPPKGKVSLPNRQNSTQNSQQHQQSQQTKIKHAFSSDFGSKTFLIVDKNSNQRYQMVPTAEDEELVDDNHEVIQMHNGKAHRYAMIPAEDQENYEFSHKQEEEEETCLSNPDLNRSENFLPRNYELNNRSSSMRTSTPQKGISMSNLHSYPNTPLKNPQATKMLHELLSTPPRKTPIKTPHRTPQNQYTTPRQMYTSQRDLRLQYTPQQNQHHLQNALQQSAAPSPPPPLLPRKNSQLSPQRLHYETVKPVMPLQSDRTMAVIQPRLAGARIHPQLQEEDEEEEEDCDSRQHKSRIAPTYPEKIANATITLAIVSLMLVLGSSMNSALIVYMIAHMGKSFYLQFSLVAAISGVGLGFLGFRSRHCEWLPNRSYTSGYILVTMFCLLKCCGLLVILVFDPYPGLPLHDVTTGIILGLSTFTMFFIGLGVIGTLWCYRPPPDNRVDVVKMNEYQREHAEAAADITSYVSNPINAYLLTKRLTTDWKQVENLMAHDVGGDFLTNITNYRSILKFPSDEDLNGAAVALMRLQDTYNLDTSSLARGELNGIQYSTEMSSDDCFELGRQSYVNHDYYHTVLWMNEAMTRMLDEPRNRTLAFTKADILEYLAFSTYKQGNVESALSMTNELLQLIPNHERASGNKIYYEKELKELSLKKKVKGDDGTDDTPKSDLPISKAEPYSLFDQNERKTYELLCQGKLKPTPQQLRPLRCRYTDNNVPFLKIGPMKVEEASMDPYIVVYYDVIFDSEIELIKKMARPRFRRATVQNSVTGELETANYRISKSSWLKTEEHPIIETIVQRTEDMTGLDMTTAEELQVVNYGIGGHYEPHFDFARREEVRAFQGLNTGNRIATVLFYMSDVEQGGATVFTAINTALWPKKGAAAFWYNLHRSGEGDYRTRHAACPVLTGSKWVSNKWIHESRQEFRRPCALEPDHGEFAI